MLARPPSTGMAFEQEPVLLHQPIDALGVDRSRAGGSPLALEERGDPPVAVGRALIDETPDVGGQLAIALAGLRSTSRPSLVAALDDVRPCDAQRGGDGLYGISSGSGERGSKVGFFARARSSASLKISASMVLRPSSGSSSRTRSFNRCTSEAQFVGRVSPKVQASETSCS